MFIFVSAWAVIEGIEVIARNSYMAVIITVFIIVLTFILLLKQMDFSNFLPIFEIPINDFVSGVHTMTIIPFCEIFAFKEGKRLKS